MSQRAGRKRKPPARLDENDAGVAAEEADGVEQGDARRAPGGAEARAAAAQEELASLARQQAPGQISINRVEFAEMLRKIQEYEAAAQEAREKNTSVKVTEGELDNLVSGVVRLMLFKMHEKSGVPVRRQELVELIQADYKEHKAAKKLPGLVIPLAQAKMASVLGLELRELKRVTGTDAAAKKGGAAAAAAAAAAAGGQVPAAAAGGGGAGTSTYVAHSLLPKDLYKEVVGSPADHPKHGLLMTVLSLLDLSGGSLEEEELWRHLGSLGLAAGSEHPDFGDPKDRINEFLNTRYLNKTKSTGPRGEKVVVQWGEHAVDEVGQATVREFINKEFNNAQRLAVGARDEASAAQEDQENLGPGA